MSGDLERQNAIEWYSTGIDNDYRSRRETLVRAWRPGDGMRCASAGYQKAHPCTSPVAVVKDVLLTAPSRYDKTVINRVVCIRHLSTIFGSKPAAVEERDTDRAALEQLAQRHWDEFSQILTDMRDALLRDRLSALPEELRDQVIEAMTAADESGDPA